jgi:hypothetical protein
LRSSVVKMVTDSGTHFAVSLQYLTFVEASIRFVGFDANSFAAD